MLVAPVHIVLVTVYDITFEKRNKSENNHSFLYRIGELLQRELISGQPVKTRSEPFFVRVKGQVERTCERNDAPLGQPLITLEHRIIKSGSKPCWLPEPVGGETGGS